MELTRLVMISAVLASLQNGIAFAALPAPSQNGGCTDDFVGVAAQQNASGADVLKQFSASNSSNSTVVTSHILSAMTPAWLSSTGNNNNWYNDFGWDISAAVPVNTATLKDYQKQQLLGRYTGLFTLLGSAAGRNVCNKTYEWSDRRANVSHIYINDVLLHANPPTGKQFMGFISDGFGGRVLKTRLETDSTGSGGTGSSSTPATQSAAPGSYAGAGLAFLGLGVDGPIYDVQDTSKDATGGLISFEVYAAANAVNPNALNAILGIKNARSTYYDLGGNIKITLPQRLYLDLQYSKPLTGFMRRGIGDMTMITVGYNLPTTTGASQ